MTKTLSAILIGHDSLTLAAARMWREAGHAIAAVVTRHAGTAEWAAAEDVPVVALAEAPDADWLLSVANLDLLPDAVLARARRGAVNFHDGPLPERAGLNAPVWAILQGAAEHGIAWHRIASGVDTGPILAERRFALAPDETTASLNARCFAAAIEAFPDAIAAMEADVPGRAQDLTGRQVHRRADPVPDGGWLDLARPASDLARLVRALDHGAYPNPVARAKLAWPGGWGLVLSAEPAPGAGAPGSVLAQDGARLTLATGQGALRLTLDRAPPALAAIPPIADGPARAAAQAGALKAEPRHRRALAHGPARLPELGGTPGADLSVPVAGEVELALLMLTGGYAARTAAAGPGEADWLPVSVEGRTLGDARATLAHRAAMAADLPHRLGGAIQADPEVVLDGWRPGARLALIDGTLHGRDLSAEAFGWWAGRVADLARRLAMTDDAGLPGLVALDGPAEMIRRSAWNATAEPFDPSPVTEAFAARAAAAPESPALTFRDQSLTYAGLSARVAALAAALRAEGVRRGDRVAVHLPRGLDMVASVLAVLTVGAAYVPADPAYPADRTALTLTDSGARIVLTDATGAAALPPGTARALRVDLPLPAGPASGETPAANDLAYLIYTSGSTGRPKGVMVSHRNLASFLHAMDGRIARDGGAPGTWLAVTSLSFDISILELLWSLSRGWHVVLQGEEERVIAAADPSGSGSGSGIDVSLYYWGNDDGAGRDKYRLLLDGARFADAHGFRAVWTPERHFHAFGGPYPNPSVTGAAVAAVTRNLDVRAGSCVAPLHHPARIAEEWAVIDNLTNGRAGLAFASGWQPEDFALRPENAPPGNKAAMLTAIDQVRRLWRGEGVEFPGPMGTQTLRTQPRPVSRELPVWVTTAGNPDTWREAGRIGANVLTHLLGQSVAEVGEKIALYHAALREAGHDPARFQVTLMLHTCLAATRDAARETAREPMKAYLRSAAGLIKQYAWAFPAFKKPQGVAQAMDIDLRDLSGEELEAILDFAFERYFEESGLFGTIDDAVARLDEVAALGVTEVACLIDYGIAADTVLAGLVPLAEAIRRTRRADAAADDDWSVAAQIARHDVTHLQCTPSMARLLMADPAAARAVGRLEHLMVGGEALPGKLARELLATGVRVTNMYGPTETTIWSATHAVTGDAATEPVGRPIANATLHILDDDLQPRGPGEEGELWIGGPGVAQGYWNRPDLTAERFVRDPFGGGGRLYRTGDLARRRLDGTVEFLGRADGQVKVRGFRIETGEIEAALEAQGGVRQAVVIAREDATGTAQLWAFATGDIDEAALKTALAVRLPAHMVPARVVAVESFPLTPNRKVDRKALAATGAPVPAPTTAPTTTAVPTGLPPSLSAPSRGTSLPAVAAIWTRLLGVPAPQPSQSFFDLGGHSLLAVQAHREIKSSLGVPGLAITDIFRFPTLGALARRIDELGGVTRTGAANVPSPAPGAGPGVGPGVADAEGPGASDARADARADAMARRRALRDRRTGS